MVVLGAGIQLGRGFSLCFFLGDLEKCLNLLRHWKQIESNTIKCFLTKMERKLTVCIAQAGHILFEIPRQKNKGLLITHTQISLVSWRSNYLGKTM